MKCVALSTYEWSTVVGDVQTSVSGAIITIRTSASWCGAKRREVLRDLEPTWNTIISVSKSLWMVLSLVLLLLRLYSCGQFTATGVHGMKVSELREQRVESTEVFLLLCGAQKAFTERITEPTKPLILSPKTGNHAAITV
ncbi:hypothetical protein K1719_040910 [Acacia pycnantha]|nr:hypothetical protein K1719_040910 [Acacia pycnantha]